MSYSTLNVLNSVVGILKLTVENATFYVQFYFILCCGDFSFQYKMGNIMFYLCAMCIISNLLVTVHEAFTLYNILTGHGRFPFNQ